MLFVVYKTRQDSGDFNAGHKSFCENIFFTFKRDIFNNEPFFAGVMN